MRCEDIERDLDCLLDGELAQPERIEAEAHVRDCSSCLRLVSQRRELRCVLREVVRVPTPRSALMPRLLCGLDEIDRQCRRQNRPPSLLRRLPAYWGRRAAAVLSVSAAAGLVLWVQAVVPRRPQRSHPQVVELTIGKHLRNQPLEITGGPDVVRSWFDGKVPFAVPTPRLEPIASLRGGRLSNLGDREAALLQYDRRGRTISVFVFDANGIQGVPLADPRRAVIGNREVYLQGAHGYQVAFFRDRDLGYAIAGSVDEPEFIQLISAAVGGH
jgi:anti-sigma factor RsiW